MIYKTLLSIGLLTLLMAACAPATPPATAAPVVQPSDTLVPTDTDTPEPTETDTPEPTETDTPEPTETDTPEPTETDTPEPTETATPEPTDTLPPPTNTLPPPTNTPAPVNTAAPVNTVAPPATVVPTVAVTTNNSTVTLDDCTGSETTVIIRGPDGYSNLPGQSLPNRGQIVWTDLAPGHYSIDLLENDRFQAYHLEFDLAPNTDFYAGCL